MALALAHTAASNVFNTDFYAAAATIIPVLFLAITLQGDVYKGLLRYWEKSFLEYMSAVATTSLTKRAMVRALASYIAGSAAWTIVVASTAAEIVAIWSLLSATNILPPVLIALTACGLAGTVGISFIWANAQAALRLSAPYFRAYRTIGAKMARGEITTPEQVRAYLFNPEGALPPAAPPPPSGLSPAPDEPGTA